MTVATTVSRVDYTGNGALTTYPYDFKIFDDADLDVYVDGSLQVLDVDYTVTGAGVATGGNVVFTAAPGDTLAVAIIRLLDITQETDYVELDKFPAETHEAALDKLTMIDQQLQESLRRSLKFADSSTFRDVPMPDLVASQFLQVNAAGTALQLTAGTAPVSSSTFLDGSQFQGLWYESSTYASINAAITAIGATVGTLVVSTAETLTGNLTVPATLALVIQKGGSIVKASTYTLAINGPLSAGKFQVFSGFSSGEITLSDVNEVYPEWWTTNTTPGTTDMTAAINYAIATAVKNTHRTPVILSDLYSISGPITINTDGTTILGGGNFGGWITCTTSNSGFVIDKGGGEITYEVKLKDIYIHGNNTAEEGLKLVNANECIFESIFINVFTVCGINSTGYYTNFTGSQVKIAYCPVAIRLEAGVFIRLVEANFYECETMVNVLGTIFVLIFDNSWFEAFTTFLNQDSTANHCHLMSATLKNCYFLSTKGGGSYSARVIKSIATSNTYLNKIRVLKVDGCYFYLTNAKYMLEVNWNGYFAGGELFFSATLKDNYFHVHTNSTAWIKTDNENLGIRWVKIEFQNNQSLLGVLPVQDGSQIALDLEYFAGSDATPSVASRSSVYKTQNYAPTEITNFDGGHIGQRIAVIFSDALTSVNFTGGYLRGNAGVDWLPTVGDWMDCVKDETGWYCMVNNTSLSPGGGTPPTPPVIPASNLITTWLNSGYYPFDFTGANITSAVLEVAASVSATTGLFWIDGATDYRITATLTQTSGEAPHLLYLDGGIAVDCGALSPGANIFNFTSTSNQSMVVMTNTDVTEWSCTFTFLEV